MAQRHAYTVRLIVICALAMSVAQHGNSQTSDEAIGRWIGELSHASYHRRERASRQLAAAGGDAVSRLATAADGDDLEVTSRATQILLRLAERPATAEAALEILAKLSSRSVQQRAAAKALIATLRSERRMARLRQLGARVTVVRGRWAETSGVHVRIDDDWKGGSDGLKELIGLEQLTVLHFDGAPLGDDALARLAPLRDVEELKIWYMPITDDGIRHLRHWNRLRTLQLYGTDITADGAAALAKRLPAAVVDRRAGALLGIGPRDEVGPCQIGVIRAGSAAAKAGLQLGDVLIEFDGQKVADFDNLRTLIALKKPGEQVQIAYTRDGQRHENTVTLGRWE
jgi:hypothetical protein